MAYCAITSSSGSSSYYAGVIQELKNKKSNYVKLQKDLVDNKIIIEQRKLVKKNQKPAFWDVNCITHEELNLKLEKIITIRLLSLIFVRSFSKIPTRMKIFHYTLNKMNFGVESSHYGIYTRTDRRVSC